MKREILFRGKCFDTGLWIYGDLIRDVIGGNVKYYIKMLDCKRVRVHLKTIGQYTGLKDKNGVGIFEGDYIHVPYNFIGKQEVKYLEDKVKWSIADYNLSLITAHGNIHDE